MEICLLDPGAPPRPATVGVSLQLNVVKMLSNVSGFLTLFRPLSFSSPCSAVMTSHCSLHVYLQADTHIHTLRRSVLCVYSLPVSRKEKIGEWVRGCAFVCVCMYSGWAIDRWISEVTERKGEMCEGEESLMDCEESKNNDVVCGYVCLRCVCGYVRLCVCVSDRFLFIPELM